MAQVDEAKVILGNRKSGLLLSHIGYIYARNRKRGDKMYWRCIEPSCGVFLHTNVFQVSVGSTTNVVNIPGRHNHREEDASISRREITEEMLGVVQADPCAAVRAAYDNVLANCTSSSVQSIPSFQQIQNRLRRKRQTCFPPCRVASTTWT